MIADGIEFQKIYGDFRLRVFHYLRRLVGEHEAEDLTQEVFLKVSRALNDFRGDSSLSTWLYRIATNTALDKLRNSDFKKISRKKPDIDPDETNTDDNDDWTNKNIPPADQQLIRKEMHQCIRNHVDGLPDAYRTAIVLSEIEELKNHEIAEILGISLDTVKIRLHRARAKLKKELENHCSFYRDERNEFACDRKNNLIAFRSKL